MPRQETGYIEWPKCSICKEPYAGHGHNAQPVNDGQCCGFCNTMVVIPARLRTTWEGKEKPSHGVKGARE